MAAAGGPDGAEGTVKTDPSTVTTADYHPTLKPPGMEAPPPPMAGPSPAAVSSAALGFPGVPSQIRGEPPVPRYNRHAVSPLIYLAVALVAGAVAAVVFHWAVQPVDDPSKGGLSPAWWEGVYRVVLQGKRYPRAVYDGERVMTAAAVLVAVAIPVVAWIRRIGQNARIDAGYFGAPLVIAAVFGWWTIPLSMNVGTSYGAAKFRIALGLVILVLQSLFARWPFTHKVWRAGHLPLESVAFFLWLPMFVATFWYYGAVTYSVFAVGENGRGDSGWVPTELTQKLWIWSTRATGALVLALLVAVSVIQHIGIRKDRAEDEAYRSSGILPPGAQPSEVGWTPNAV